MALPDFRSLVKSIREKTLEKASLAATGLNHVTKDIVERAQQVAVDNLTLEQGLSLMGRFPSPGEYRSNVQHALESWPASLHALSLPSRGLELTQEELERIQLWSVGGDIQTISEMDAKNVWKDAKTKLATITDGKGNSISEDPVISGLIQKINDALPKMPFEKPFFKLGTRSGKDSPLHQVSDGRIESGEQVMLLLLTSRRLFADLANDEGYWQNPQDSIEIGRAREMQAAAQKLPIEEFAKMVGTTDLQAAEALRNRDFPEPTPHAPHLWFREYRQFPRHAEFRCFIGDGKYLGATQYHDIVTIPEKMDDGKIGNRVVKADPFEELVRHGWEYDRILRDYAPIFMAAATTMKSAIYDVVVDKESEDVFLLETNPANSKTFPGLKDWSRPETFNGELDWIVEPMDLIMEEKLKLNPEKLNEIRFMIEDREKYLAEHKESDKEQGRIR